jgi:hypothetical protein
MSPWTPERDALLKELWTAGHSAALIADQIKDVAVSRSAVIGRAHRFKLPSRRPRQSARRKPRKSARRKPRQLVPKPKPQLKPPPTVNGEPVMQPRTLLQLKPNRAAGRLRTARSCFARAL